MDWQEALLNALSFPIPWETRGLPSGSPSFTLQFENLWPRASNLHHRQKFQLVTQHRRQDCLVTVASSRGFTCCPCNGKVVRFCLGPLRVVAQHCSPLSALPPTSHCLSRTSVGKSSLPRPQPIFAGGPRFLPLRQVLQRVSRLQPDSNISHLTPFLK